MTYGYVRISNKDQSHDRQTNELLDCGILQNNLFIDIASGKDFERPQYINMRKLLKRGDILIVKSIDRLGRNYDMIIQEWRYLTKDRGVNIKILDMPLLDTTLRGEDLTGVFISDLVLQILSYVAQVKRENIKQRQREGIAISRANGKHLGRPKVTYPTDFKRVYCEWKNKI